ncbi:hypothetical protein IP90_00640 [Luteimonas cucumeris]|uniref:Aminomethyltransferase folate-binding domain-containing protein n=1 Tax=Luteimonas cucumeris TaxID=985012 RepID=A0A562LA12_9GAMM|nr:folate-binding protein [Luteimonas cucumeris]TWI04507.1 hypothetical protein IP90_00640 [Luteimonas cucumeris]
MNDVKALAAGQWQWNGWLTPKGRVIALFALLKLDDERIWLLLQDADPAELAARLQRFVFRSKVTVRVREDLLVSGAFGRPDHARGARLAVRDEHDIELDLGAAGSPRTLRVTKDAGAILDEVALARWAAVDLAHGLPRLAAAQSEQWTPQQLSLGRLQAYSVKKGCYPGQEIVARTHFLGQAKRGLALFECEAPAAAGMSVGDDGRALGSIVSVAASDQKFLALAVLPLDSPEDKLNADGIALRPMALLDGLAR